MAFSLSRFIEDVRDTGFNLFLLFCTCCGLCWFCAEERHKRRKLAKESARVAPQPIPQSRPRALTLPLPPPTKSKQANQPPQTTADQSQSLLLSKLSLEIRRLIYEEVLGYKVVHILSLYKRMAHVRCNDAKNSLPYRHRCFPGPVMVTGRSVDWVSRSGGLLGLLKTCRQV